MTAETLIIVVLVAAAHLLLIHMILRKLGIGTSHGKPDCGCGTCHTKPVHRSKFRPNRDKENA